MASAYIDVYVKMPTGKAISLHHLPSETVNDIAKKVADSEGIPESRTRLKYQGKVLDKKKTIAFLGICAETILKAEFIVPKDLSIKLKLPKGDEQNIVVQSTDSVSRLKDTIHDISGVKPHKLLLKLNGRVTLSGDDKLLCDSGLTDGSVLHVTEKVVTSDSTTESDTEEASDELRDGLMSTFNAAGRRVEVVFCFDTTGSMYSCLHTVRQKLRESCQRLLRDIPNIRIGIMANGDYCDYSNYVIRYIDLTDDVNALVDFAENVPSTGGGDAPEAYEWALRKAQQLDWSEDSAKAFVLIADDVPHPPSYTDQHVFWMNELDVLVGMEVKVYGVHAGTRTSTEAFYRELAERSSGFFLKLNNFNLITDMFLAVCYREADDGQLGAFVEEVKTEGRMTEDAKLFLDTLEEKQDSETKKIEPSTSSTQRYYAQEWWDPTLCRSDTRHQYCYDQEQDKWQPANRPIEQTTYTDTSVTHIVTTSKRPVQRKKSVLKRIFGVFRKS